jgi:hypothetical protein
MGRELKSGGRSLSVLGIGRHNNNVLHMHVTGTVSSSATTTTVTKRSRPSASTTSTPAAGTTHNGSNSQNNSSIAPTGTNLKADPVIDLLSDSEDEDALEVVESRAAGSGRKRRRG